MKIQLRQISTVREISVDIIYNRETNELHRLLEYLELYDQYLICEEESKQIKVSLKDIFYIEVLERKTFVYCLIKVYECKEKLVELEEKIKKFGYLRINRTCLLNLEVLTSMKILTNSRLEATLENGEKVIISRKYIREIQKYFELKKEGHYGK